MKRFVIALAIAFTLVASVRADEGSEAGQKFLQKLGASWSQKLPEPSVMGVYVGRKWIGKATFTVKATTEGGAKYDFTTDTEFNLMGNEFHEHSHALLSDGLTVVAADSEGVTPEGKESKKLTVKDGKWTLHTEKGAEKNDTNGDVTPTTVWDGGALLAFATPEAKETTLVALKSDASIATFTLGEAKEKLTLGGKEGEYRVVVAKGEHENHWYLDDAGHGVYMHFTGAPFCGRPCVEANVGKDIDEPLVLSEPVQKVIDLYMAIKKSDGDAAMATFDLPTMAKDSGEAVDAVEASLKESMLTPQAAQALPDPAMLPDFFSAMATSTVNGDEAEVSLGGSVFKMHKVNDASGTPTWLIYGVGR